MSGIRMSMLDTLPFSGASQLRAVKITRSAACLILLTLGLSACGSTKSVQVTEENVPLIRLADGLRDRGELPTAIAIYQRAASQSQDAGELISLGQTLAEAGASEQAAGAFRRALARAPENPDALLGLGTSLLATGDIDKSIQYLEQLVDQGRSSDTVRYAALGAALDIAGRHEQAVATYTAGLEVAPGNLDLKSNLALSYAFYDRHVEAINLMIEVTDALEASRTHYRNHVLVLALAGQDHEAASTGVRMLGEKETQDVMAQAATVRQLPRGADRARAIGLS